MVAFLDERLASPSFFLLSVSDDFSLVVLFLESLILKGAMAVISSFTSYTFIFTNESYNRVNGFR